MRITESKLKSIIRQVIKESEHESVQALADRHPELHDVEPVAPLSPELRDRTRRNRALSDVRALGLMPEDADFQKELASLIARLRLLQR